MGRRRSGNRVTGPYRDKDGWRYREVVGGVSSWLRCRARTEAEAHAEVAGARALVESDDEALDVRGAVSAYADHLRATESKQTGDWTERALSLLAERAGELPAEALQARHAQAFLEDLEDLALATQRSYWLAFVRACKWWSRRGTTVVDPAAMHLQRLDRLGQPLPWLTKGARKRMGRGKPQLRNMEEVHAYIVAAKALGAVRSNASTSTREERRVAAVLPLICGASSGEVLHLTVGDVDFRGGWLWVRDDDADDSDGWEVKTASRRRALEMPEAVRGELEVLCADREPGDYLFAQRARGGLGRSGAARSPTWLRKLVREVCETAGVRVVCPHGLRDTHASVVKELTGATAAQIGSKLGHGDAGKTAREHYIGASDRVPALRVVGGGSGGGES